MVECLLIDGTKEANPRELADFNKLCKQIAEKIKYLYDIKEFKRITFLTHKKIDHSFRVNGVNYQNIKELNFNGYQNLSVFGLHRLCFFDYLITCQIDGFPINLDLWDESFLDYDYIGAPWSKEVIKAHMSKYGEEDVTTEFIDNIPLKYYMGNSGFCLRSKKFLETCTKTIFPVHLCPVHGNHFTDRVKFDDWFFSVGAREFFEIRGINYAPVEIASRFALEPSTYSTIDPAAPFFKKADTADTHDFYSLEYCITEKVSFGIHGKDFLRYFIEHNREKL